MLQAMADLRSTIAPIKRTRQIIYRLLIVLLTLVACEIASFLVVWFRTGEPMFWSDWAHRQDRLIQQYSNSMVEGYPTLTQKEGRMWADQTGLRRDVIHPYLGYVCDPTMTRYANQFGFRGKNPLQQQRSEDKLIVAILGGSVAEGFSWDGMPAVERLLKNHPQFSDKEFLVVNLANGGYKQPQQLLVLTLMLAMGAHFDIVINIDGFNEVALDEHANAIAGIFPAYPNAWNAFVRPMTDPTTRQIVGRKEYLQSQVVSLAKATLKSPLCFSMTVNAWTMMRQDRLIQELYDAELELRDHLAAVTNHDLYFVTGPSVHLSVDERMALLTLLWKQCSIQLSRLCYGNGIRYFHFLQPNQYAPDSKPMSPEERARAYKKNSIYKPGVEKGYPLLIDEGKELLRAGVRFVDLTKVFVDFNEPVYIDDCCHLDLSGYELVATKVAQTILDDYQSSQK